MSLSLRWSHTALLHEMPSDSIWTKVSMENQCWTISMGKYNYAHKQKWNYTLKSALCQQIFPSLGDANPMLDCYLFISWVLTRLVELYLWLIKLWYKVKNETQWSSMWCLHSGKRESPLSFQWVHNEQGRKKTAGATRIAKQSQPDAETQV